MSRDVTASSALPTSRARTSAAVPVTTISSNATAVWVRAKSALTVPPAVTVTVCSVEP